jgi:hypothetical protein
MQIQLSMKHIFCLIGFLAFSGIAGAQHYSGKFSVHAGLAGKNTVYKSDNVYGGLNFQHSAGLVYFKTATLANAEGAGFADIKPEANPLIEIKYSLPTNLSEESVTTTPKKIMVLSSVQVGAKIRKMELPLTLSKNDKGEMLFTLNFTENLSKLTFDTKLKTDPLVFFNFSGTLTSTK